MYGRWEDGRGAVHCWKCFRETDVDQVCDECEGAGFIFYDEEPGDAVKGDSVEEIFDAVSVVCACAQGDFPRSPNEWLEQSGLFIDAYKFLHPFVALEVKLEREREEKNG